MTAPRYGSHVNNVWYQTWHLGTRTADVTEVVSFDAPFDGKLVLFEVTAKAATGTNPTLTADIQQGTTSLLASVVSFTAGARTEATLATSTSFVKDTQISVDLDIGGTDTPTFTEVCILAGFERY